jgi:glycosyltransferase involved in cell wall biosynthesis
MKVLHIETGRHLYGGARQVAYIIEGLHQRGVENILACQQSSAIAAEMQHVAQVYEFSTRGDIDFRLLFKLRKLIKRCQPDLIHCHSRRGADIWGGLAGRLSGIPTVLSRRVDNPEPLWWVGQKYRLYDRVICISEGIRQVLLSEGVAADKAVTVRSAINVDDWQQDCQRTSFDQKFHTQPGQLVLGIVAQLIPRKGHSLLLQAMQQLATEYPQLQLVCFGKGPLKDALQQEASERGLQERVQFVGFRNDLQNWMGCIDVLVHPALMEGLGISLIQAAACAVPIIASRAGGMPEIVRHEQNGLLIEPGDLDALVQALKRLIDEPETRQQFGQAGRQLVQSEFSIDAMVQGNLAVYQQLCTAGIRHEDL